MMDPLTRSYGAIISRKPWLYANGEELLALRGT
jgi:hypothetical protein